MFNAIESIPNTINYCSRIIREKIDSLLSAPKNVGIKIIDTKMEDDILRINIDISNSDKERLLQKVNIGFIFWKNKKQIYDYTFSVSEFIGSEEKSTFEISFIAPKNYTDDMEIVPIIDRAFFVKNRKS